MTRPTAHTKASLHNQIADEVGIQDIVVVSVSVLSHSPD